MKKERVLIRFRPEIYECFELEAAYQGLRVGTIANQLLISELNKAFLLQDVLRYFEPVSHLNIGLLPFSAQPFRTVKEAVQFVHIPGIAPCVD